MISRSRILTAVVPILVDEGVSFKVVVDEQMLDFSNSTFWGRGACGKFVTLYPADTRQLERLLPRLVPDERLPYFALPEGIADPFPDTEEEEEDEDLILKGRYKAVAALGSSSKGGVYRCLDLETNTEVVVKEARPLVNRVRRNPYDAVDCLRNETRILKRLEGTGVAPRPIESFETSCSTRSRAR